MDTTSSDGAHALKPAANNTGRATPVPRATPIDLQSHPLPREPLVTIQPSRGLGLISLREFWLYRELLYFLTWRDIKVRYKQAALGVAWVVLQPLMLTLIFTVFLGMLARVPSEVPYPLLVYIGLLPWTFFSAAISSSSNSLVGNAHLITKVFFPRVLIPMSAVGGRLVDFGVASLILILMMAYYRVTPTWNLLALPPLVLLTTLLALALGLLFSALNVKYRDVGFILPILIQSWMYVTPVLYPIGLVPREWRRLYDLNPLVGVVEGFRAAVLGGEFNAYALGFSVVATLLLLGYSAYLFGRTEKSFTDVI